MGFFEFRLSVKCPVTTVFATYTDTDAWIRSTEISKVEWVGKPWQEGSRIRVKGYGDTRDTIDQVLLHFEPPRSVAYISHFLGMTLETRLMFQPVSADETEVQVRGEFVGMASKAFGFALGPAIERATRKTLEDLSTECERIAATQAHPAPDFSPERQAPSPKSR
ncbi:MAG TPA: SRPBCC family protein [Candidatus Sulfotelmatobacter sp.]|nr:SRPBCC family protein [Candidatus Sulfotelmatobacter sp.]